MLLGRHLDELFAAAWPSATGDYADAMTAITTSWSRGTLAEATWTNTTIVGGDVPGAVRELKEHGDGELVRYGHGPLGQALLDNGLLDELRLWIHPLVVGHGNRLSGPDARARLRLVGTQTRANGVVVTDEAAR
jgi:dihydrofolate reductase